MKLVQKANRFVSDHPRLNYVLMCIKHVNDKRFVYDVLGKNPENVNFQCCGGEYPDKIIYLIEIGTKGDGFFAEYRRMLNYLYYAKEHALTPFVYFNDQFEYIDNIEQKKSYNYFDDYFVQYCDLEFNKVFKAKTLIRGKKSDVNLAEGLKENCAYSVSDEYLNTIAKVARQYISFNERVQIYVDNSLEKINFASNMIGVHVRGSDYKKGYKGHPVFVSPEDFLEKTISVMRDFGCKKVFLASDDLDTIQLFHESLGDQVISYSDVHRTDSDTSVINIENDDKHYKSDLAKEVIRDMLTLSKCRILIAGMSQVSICARISNLAWEKKYEKVFIMDNGINKDGKIYLG